MTTTAAPTTTIGVSRALQLATVSATTALGAVLGLIVRGLVGWLERTLDGSPGPLRIAAQLPVGVAAGVLTVVGLIGGIIPGIQTWMQLPTMTRLAVPVLLVVVTAAVEARFTAS